VTKKKKKARRGTIDHPHLWGSLLHRFQDLIEWALDIAVQLARDYDEELDAIERVRGYVRGWLSGRAVDLDMDDVLTTLAILFAAIEIDEGIDSEPLLEPLRTCPRVVHLPGADHDRIPTVVIKRFPRHRNAGALFTQLAA
jgi:hypothetical protein